MLNPRPQSQGQKFSYSAAYKKKIGILTLFLREKHLCWNSQVESAVLNIRLDNIIEIKKATKESNTTELIFLKVVGTEKGVVFAFNGEKRVEIRDRFYDLLTRKDEYDKVLRSLPFFEKKRILQILLDPQLNYLFEELVITYKIISKEDFHAYIRKRYTPKITFVVSQQLIQLARSDEIQLFSNPSRNVLDYATKKKILLSNDMINILYEVEKSTKKSEQNFWREFLNNQKKNATELVGGFKPIFFTNEEERTIKTEKEKIRLPHVNNGNTVNLQIPPNSISSSTSVRAKITKKNENFEIHKNYYHKHFGSCISVAEFDYKDREIKKISASLSEEEEFNKKEMANFIENVNNYSIRKIENINYISVNNFALRLNKSKPQTQAIPIQIPIQITKVEENTITTNENKMHIDEPVIEIITSKKFNTMSRLQEMKTNKIKSDNDSDTFKSNTQKSVDTFLKLNELVKQNALYNLKPLIPDREKASLEHLRWRLNLLRDLVYIAINLKSASYTEDIKRFKRAGIKRLTQDTEEKMKKFESEENLNPLLKSNYQIYKASLTKLKS